jgi:hypothetical protein
MDWGSFKEGVQDRGGNLSHINIGSISGSSVDGILGNKLVALGDSLLPKFICNIHILIWGWAKIHNFIFI